MFGFPINLYYASLMNNNGMHLLSHTEYRRMISCFLNELPPKRQKIMVIIDETDADECWSAWQCYTSRDCPEFDDFSGAFVVVDTICAPDPSFLDWLIKISSECTVIIGTPSYTIWRRPDSQLAEHLNLEAAFLDGSVVCQLNNTGEALQGFVNTCCGGQSICYFTQQTIHDATPHLNLLPRFPIRDTFAGSSEALQVLPEHLLSEIRQCGFIPGILWVRKGCESSVYKDKTALLPQLFSVLKDVFSET